MNKPAKRRRQKGTGTNIVREANGDYTQRVDLGVDPITGKRLRTRIRAKSEAALRMRVEHARVRVGDRGNVGVPVTLGELYDLYVESYRVAELTEGARGVYETVYDNHIRPFLHDRLLSEVNSYTFLTAFYKRLRTEGRSGNRVAATRQYVGTLLAFAQKRRFIEYNANRDTDIVKRELRKKFPNLSDDELATFIAASYGHAWGHIWRFALMTQLRPGELFAMYHSDVNRRRNVLLVQRHIGYNRQGNRWLEKGAKTLAGKREILLSPSMLAALDMADHDHDLAFPNHAGHMIFCETGNNQLRAFLKRVELPAFTMHNLRRLGASFLARHGVPDSTIQERLGHEAKTVMAESYFLPDVSKQQAACDAFETFLTQRFGPGKGRLRVVALGSEQSYPQT